MTRSELRNRLNTLGINYTEDLITNILNQADSESRRLYISKSHALSSIIYSLFRRENSKNKLKMSKVWKEKAACLDTIKPKNKEIEDRINNCHKASKECLKYENSIACLEPI